MKNKIIWWYLLELNWDYSWKMESIPSGEIKCPKSGLFTNYRAKQFWMKLYYLDIQHTQNCGQCLPSFPLRKKLARIRLWSVLVTVSRLAINATTVGLSYGRNIPLRQWTLLKCTAAFIHPSIRYLLTALQQQYSSKTSNIKYERHQLLWKLPQNSPGWYGVDKHHLFGRCWNIFFGQRRLSPHRKLDPYVYDG